MELIEIYFLIPFSNNETLLSVQNSIRLVKYMLGAHRYLKLSVQFLRLAAISNSVAFMGHCSTGYTSNR